MVTENRTVTLDSEMVRKVEEMARKQRRSFGNMIQWILDEYFEKCESQN